MANAARHEWTSLLAPGPHVIIAGNPPFAGQYTKSAAQIADARHAWGRDYDGYLDYATIWHAKAARFFAGCRGGRFAFVTTNSITQGQAVPALFGPLRRAGWRIAFAHRTFAWTSHAPGRAAVHCVIIGFAKDGPGCGPESEHLAVPEHVPMPDRLPTPGSRAEVEDRTADDDRTTPVRTAPEQRTAPLPRTGPVEGELSEPEHHFAPDWPAPRAPRLFDYPDPAAGPVETPVRYGINAYLIDGPDLLVRKRAKPLSRQVPPVGYGSKPSDGGGLMVAPAEYGAVAADTTAARYLRRYVGAEELTRAKDRWCLWLAGADPEVLASSPVLAARLECVRRSRTRSRKARTRALAVTPHLFAENRQPTVPYLAIPAHVSEARRYFTVARFDADVICGNANFLAPDGDGFLFGLISSSMFMTWQRALGGRIRSDLRFSNTVVWNNLPLPPVPPSLRREIVERGVAVAAARRLAPDKSLAEHYRTTAMAPALMAAHDALDEAVDRAFGAAGRCATEPERQALLFRRYAELSSRPHR